MRRASLGLVTRVAAVDCGTNSLRLLVADVAGEWLVDVHREMRVVRLGQDVDRTGVLGVDALQRTRVALVDYAATCRALGATTVRMVATSATRDAANRDDFVAMVVDALGAEPEVVDGEEEAALSFAGATRGLDRADGPFLVVDVGGGSTELALASASCSMDVGCVRLTERHLHSDPPSPDEVDAARTTVLAGLAAVRDSVPTARARTSVWVAGSATTVAAQALALPSYDAGVLHLARLDAARVHEACAVLLAMTRAERAALPFMHPGRVDVIGAGALVIDVLVRELGVDELVVSEADILDGIAWSIVTEEST